MRSEARGWERKSLLWGLLALLALAPADGQDRFRNRRRLLNRVARTLNAPSALAARATSSSTIALAWRDNSWNETGFQVERGLSSTSFAPLVTLPANVAAYVDSGLSPNTRYFYRVRAVRASAVSGWSNVAGAVTAAAGGREAAWATTYDGWEVLYDGRDSAADNVPNHLRWDSAVDDDYWLGNSSFRLNTPEPGIMSVDRVTNPADNNKTGNIWRRDEFLSNAAGFTIELRLLLLPNSMRDAYSITYLDDGGSFGVHLSPDQIKVGGLASANPGNVAAFDTTDQFHVYRVVKQPGNMSVAVYVDGNAQPLVQGQGNGNYAVGSSSYLLYPRVLIGDNENDPTYNANYQLDYVRYRRGAFPPGTQLGPIPARTPVSLPPRAPPGEAFNDGFDGTFLPGSNGWVAAGGGNWTLAGGGVVEFNGMSGGGNTYLDNPPGLTNMGAYTIEMRLRVLPDSEPQGFSLWYVDQMGATAITLSTDKVEMFLGTQPVGVTPPVSLNTTDDFHIYRIVRDARGLYAHLYVDNNPVPAIVDMHIDGAQLSFPRIHFGDMGMPQAASRAHVLIDYIRWHDGAYAP